MRLDRVCQDQIEIPQNDQVENPQLNCLVR
jgi:hypothetical protein